MTIEEAISYLSPIADSASDKMHYGEALEVAISALRAQAERENPQPLTMKELRRMDGQPVWVIFKEDADGERLQMWVLVEIDVYGSIYMRNSYGSTYMRNSCGGIDKFSNWQDILDCGIESIYRSKPKEATHD